MNSGNSFLIVVLCCWSAVQSVAQDPRFSQFYAAPLQTNAALNGVFEGRVRAAMNYRVLYPTLLADKPFRTYSASIESRFRVVKKDYISLGLGLRKDEAGVGPLSRTQAILGTSFLKQLSGNRKNTTMQYVVGGVQVGMEQHSIGLERLWFSSQYDIDNNTVNTSLSSGEAYAGMRSNLVPDLNAGVLWYAVVEEQTSVYLGAGVQHILEPRVGFLNESFAPLYRKYTVHTGGELPLTKQLSLLPAAVYSKQGPSTSITGGGNFRYTNRYWREVALRSGVWAHLAGQAKDATSTLGLDAITVTAIFEMERWNLGFSYDVTGSSLRKSNYSRGAFEVALVYFQPAKERFKVKCPKY